MTKDTLKFVLAIVLWAILFFTLGALIGAALARLIILYA